MRTARRRNEQLVAPWPGTGRFFHNLGWALALARRLAGRPAGSLLRLPPLVHPLAIPAALSATTLAATVRLPPRLTGTPGPPPSGRLLACRPAIPGLRPPRLKELLAPLQQTAAPPRPPTRALPRKRSSIKLKRTQGRANSQRSSPGEEIPSSPGHLTPAASSLGLPAHQANRLPPWPPHSGRHTPPAADRPPVGRPRLPPATRHPGRRNGSVPDRR
jgi:hypothetical protein